MLLDAGTRLGPHQIVGLLGAGGMGEVYRAHDTKLNRQVAIKILPAEYANDPARVSRFEREAKAVAALNHPGIAGIYDFEHEHGIRYLVLELVEGETLADTLRRGRIPAADALTVVRQICEALEVAHAHNICHRDLKPANIKITPDGAVKILDFGLAKVLENDPVKSEPANSPTMSLAGTYPGVILGTAGYMSPEQAKGFAADQRSDIFSLGCILYEMLTGRQAFDGETPAEILASVLNTEPELSALPQPLNPRVIELLHRCLEKNPKNRWHSVADIRLEIDSIVARGASRDDSPAARASPWWRRATPVAAGVIGGALLAALAIVTMQPASAPLAPITRFTLMLPEGQQLAPPNRAIIALSPDGAQLVYAASDRLFVRDMSDPAPRTIAGSESTNPFNVVFSPDGRSVAYHSTVERALKRIALTGGAPVTICALPPRQTFGISWVEDTLWLAVAGVGIHRVPSAGGTLELVVPESRDESLGAPTMLPDRRTLVYAVAKGATPNRWNSAQIVAQTLGSPKRKLLIEGGSEPRYVPSGHLVYALGGSLMAVPFDAATVNVRGGPVPVVEGVRRSQSAPNSFQAAQYTFSQTGALAYVPGPLSSTYVEADLALIDRSGTAQPLKLPPAPYDAPRVSRDGKRIAVATDDGRDAAIWVYELAGGTVVRKLTFGGKNRYPIWSADSSWVAFQSDRDGDLALFKQRADGGAVERLTKPAADTAHVPHAWSPNGDVLLFSVQKGTRFALWRLNRDGGTGPWDGRVESSIHSEAVFSPDGRWVAYQSDETGSSEIYVVPANGIGPKYMVPRDLQNHHPLWSPTGGEIFYIPRQGLTFAIGVTTTPQFGFARPTPVPRGGRVEGPAQNRRNHDMLPDGRRFVGVLPAEQGAFDAAAVSSQIRIVLNWFDDLKQRVPRSDD